MTERAEFILASTSEGRAFVLRQAGLAFSQIAASVDECPLQAEAMQEGSGISASELAARLAEAKAVDVSKAHASAMVLGGDQVMECDGEIFQKAPTLEAAREQLLALRGKTHRLHSALCVAKGGKPVWRHISVAHMTMRAFSDAFLDDYCRTEGETMLHSVGGYRIEGRGIQLFSAIDGDHFTVMGLPLLPLLDYLRTNDWLTS
ncbi:MAG: Maf family protein [Alphaproteobacteria bacterium]